MLTFHNAIQIKLSSERRNTTGSNNGEDQGVGATKKIFIDLDPKVSRQLNAGTILVCINGRVEATRMLGRDLVVPMGPILPVVGKTMGVDMATKIGVIQQDKSHSKLRIE